MQHVDGWHGLRGIYDLWAPLFWLIRNGNTYKHSHDTDEWNGLSELKVLILGTQLWFDYTVQDLVKKKKKCWKKKVLEWEENPFGNILIIATIFKVHSEYRLLLGIPKKPLQWCLTSYATLANKKRQARLKRWPVSEGAQHIRSSFAPTLRTEPQLQTNICSAQHFSLSLP